MSLALTDFGFQETQVADIERMLVQLFGSPTGAGLINFTQTGQGAFTRTLIAKVRETRTPQDFGAIADGTSHTLAERYTNLAAAQADFPTSTSLTNQIDRVALEAFFLTGGGTIFTGNFYCDPFTVNNIFKVRCYKGVMFTPASRVYAGGNTTQPFIKFNSGCAGFEWEGAGLIDMRKSFFGAPSTVPSIQYWSGVEVNCSDWTMVGAGLKVINSYGYGWYIHDVGGFRADALPNEGCCAAIGIINCANLGTWKVDSLHVKNSDNRFDGVTGADFNYHVVDVRECNDFVIGSAVIDGATAKQAAGRGVFISGMTLAVNSDYKIGEIITLNMAPVVQAEMAVLATSIPGNQDWVIDSIYSRHAIDLGLELGGSTGGQIGKVRLDGEYRKTRVVKGTLISAKAGSFEDSADAPRSGRPLSSGDKNYIGSAILTRSPRPITLRGPGWRFGHVEIGGANDVGIRIGNLGNTESSFPNAPLIEPNDTVFDNVWIHGSSGPGINHANGNRLKFGRVLLENNGYDSGLGSAVDGAGYLYRAAGGFAADHAVVNGLHIDQIEFRSHIGTLTDTITYAAQTPVLNTLMPGTDMYCVEVYLKKPNLVQLGESIVAKNVLAGPTDCICRVVDLGPTDKVILQVPSAAPWLVNSNVVAMTGTFSNITTTLNGSGSLLLTEITGPAVLYHVASGQFVRVTKATTDILGIIAVAPGTPLVGATLQRVTTSLQYLDSQKYGFVMDNTDMSNLVIGSIMGNATAEISRINDVILQPGQGRWYENEANIFTGGALSPILTGLPVGYVMEKWRFILTTGVTGPTTSFELNVNNVTLALLTGIGLTVGTKASGNANYTIVPADVINLKAVGGTPTAGRIKIGVFIRRIGAESY